MKYVCESKWCKHRCVVELDGVANIHDFHCTGVSFVNHTDDENETIDTNHLTLNINLAEWRVLDEN